MKTIYISGACSADTKEGIKRNIQQARACAAVLIKKGWCVLIPHQNFYMMDEYGIDYDTFMTMDIELMRRCDAVFMLSNWKASKGAVTEHDIADHNKMVIFYEITDGYPVPGDIRQKRGEIKE